MSFRVRLLITRLAAAAALITLAAVLWLVVLGEGSSARATVADGDVVLGDGPGDTGCSPGVDVNCESTPTSITEAVAGSDTFDAFGLGDSVAIKGVSATGEGVWAQSTSGDGIFAQSGTGYAVNAFSDTRNLSAVFADAPRATGAHVQTESRFGAGLEVQIDNSSTTAPNRRGALEASTNGFGQAVLATAASGPGVEGHSKTGAAVLGVADTTSATALKATGRTTLSGPTTLAGATGFTGTTSFARSGRLTIPANATQATKTSISLGSSSSVLATIQGNVAGVYVQGVTTVTGSSGSFTIHLNKATPVDLPIAWFVLN